MKKGLRGLVMLSVCALSLASCASKVSFADFKSKAGEAVKKTVEYTTATVSGSATTRSSDSKSEQKISANLKVNGRLITPASLSDTAYAVIVNAFGITTYTVAERDGYTYYAGGSFKVTYETKDDDGNKASSSVAWNEFGLVTAIKAKGTGDNSKVTYNITVKYSK